jgi:hypothetical protein
MISCGLVKPIIPQAKTAPPQSLKQQKHAAFLTMRFVSNTVHGYRYYRVVYHETSFKLQTNGHANPFSDMDC